MFEQLSPGSDGSRTSCLNTICKVSVLDLLLLGVQPAILAVRACHCYRKFRDIRLLRSITHFLIS